LKGEREESVFALVAPAGYGKSRLLAEWAERDERPFAWVDVGMVGDEPGELLGAIAAELRRVHPAASDGDSPRAHKRASRSRQGPEPPAPAAGVLDVLGLAEHLVRAGSGAVVVLDGLEVVRAKACHEAVHALARGLPAPLKLAVASRRDVRAGLGRLRAEDRLLELGPADLAMTTYEASKLLAALGVRLDEEAVETVVDRTEGWPAGIHLAGLVLRDGGAQGEGLRLSGEDRVIADYVREEVLSPLGETRVALLRRSSVLEQLSGVLCDAVLETKGSGRALRDLARDGAMLVPQNAAETWFRPHRLVRDVLRAELELCEPEMVAPLHRRASAWFARQGMRERALYHAAAAGDASGTGSLLLEDVPALLAPERHEHERWFARFGPEEVVASPELTLAVAIDELSKGRVTAAGPKARSAVALLGEANGSADLAGGLSAIEAAAGSDGIDRLAESAEQACALLSDGALRVLSRLLRGISLHLREEREGARADLQEAAGEACSQHLPVLEALALSQLALIDLDEAWEAAADRSARALDALRSARLTREPTVALPMAVSALVKSRRGISDEAKGELSTATRLLQSLGDYMPWHEVEIRIVMARASVRLADAGRARSLLAEASRWARRARPVPVVLKWIDVAWREIDDAGVSALAGPRSLTMAELRVLRFLPTHLSFREIGERLHVSGNTVKSQAHAVYAKLEASSRSEAVAHASALGLIDVSVV
jgi:LuxR family maltose regulon positive regulatory protein